MLPIRGRSYQHCDGVSRRHFLTAGALGFAGLGLADILRAEDAAGVGSSHKAIINLHLDGGPPQMDTIDLKPNAPAEIRGEFSGISSRIAGFQVCELMPRLSALADKFSYIRSLTQSAGRHDAFQCQSGFRPQNLSAIGGRPSMGCVLTKLLGSAQDTAPTFVDLMQGRPLARNSSRPGFLGPSYKPFRPDLSGMFQRELEPGMKKELARLGANHTTKLTLSGGLDARRLNDRAGLLNSLDVMRRELDASGMMGAMDRFHQQAANILTSGRLADALDIGKEDPRVVRQYTLGHPIKERHVTSDLPNATMKFLLARRLIEAGARCVSISISDFDTHSNNFPRMRLALPIVDHGLCTLVEDLELRGMLDDVTIVAWGEFGRTPKVNKNGGRDHWPRVGPAILAGGGMRTGQIIGSTDRTASTPTSRPVTYKDVFATLYRNLGLDPHRITMVDPSGRPQYLLDGGQPLRELV